MFRQRVIMGPTELFRNVIWPRLLTRAKEYPNVSLGVTSSAMTFTGGYCVGLLQPDEVTEYEVRPLGSIKDFAIATCMAPGVIIGMTWFAGMWSGTWIADKVNSWRS